MHTELVSLIICSISDNVTNISSTPPSEVKSSIIYNKFDNFVYLNKTSIYWKYKDEILILFEAPNHHNCSVKVSFSINQSFGLMEYLNTIAVYFNPIPNFCCCSYFYMKFSLKQQKFISYILV